MSRILNIARLAAAPRAAGIAASIGEYDVYKKKKQ
jgi:hypothetical protein